MECASHICGSTVILAACKPPSSTTGPSRDRCITAAYAPRRHTFGPYKTEEGIESLHELISQHNVSLQVMVGGSYHCPQGARYCHLLSWQWPTLLCSGMTAPLGPAPAMVGKLGSMKPLCAFLWPVRKSSTRPPSQCGPPLSAAQQEQLKCQRKLASSDKLGLLILSAVHTSKDQPI